MEAIIETITQSILTGWKALNPTKTNNCISGIKVKYQDHTLGIYTLYFYSGNDKIRIKALREPDTWKIIDMT